MNTEQLDSIMRSSGAVAWGVATAEPVDSEAWERREQWISDGNNAGMEYLDRRRGVSRQMLHSLHGMPMGAIIMRWCAHVWSWRPPDSRRYTPELDSGYASTRPR